MNYKSYYKDWADQATGEWGSRWMTDSIWLDIDATTENTWVTKSQVFTVASNPSRTTDDIADSTHLENAVFKVYFTRDEGESVIIHYDDVYFGNAQPRQ